MDYSRPASKHRGRSDNISRPEPFKNRHKLHLVPDVMIFEMDKLGFLWIKEITPVNKRRSDDGQ